MRKDYLTNLISIFDLRSIWSRSSHRRLSPSSLQTYFVPGVAAKTTLNRKSEKYCLSENVTHTATTNNPKNKEKSFQSNMASGCYHCIACFLCCFYFLQTKLAVVNKLQWSFADWLFLRKPVKTKQKIYEVTAARRQCYYLFLYAFAC